MTSYDVETWHRIRRQTDGELPVQGLEDWCDEMAAGRHRDRMEMTPRERLHRDLVEFWGELLAETPEATGGDAMRAKYLPTTVVGSETPPTLDELGHERRRGGQDLAAA